MFFAKYSSLYNESLEQNRLALFDSPSIRHFVVLVQNSGGTFKIPQQCATTRAKATHKRRMKSPVLHF